MAHEWRPTEYPADEIRNQVVSQCKAVEHLAHVLARLHSDKALFYTHPGPRDDAGLLNMIGDQTAGYMDLLGNILNNMDAVTEEDARLVPVFEKAHELWPRTESALS